MHKARGVLRVQLYREQFELVEHVLPKQRGNESIDNLTALNAFLFVAVNGYVAWIAGQVRPLAHRLHAHEPLAEKGGVLDRVFEELQVLNLFKVKIEAVSLDSASGKVHPGGTGTLKKRAPKPSVEAELASTPRLTWLPEA